MNGELAEREGTRRQLRQLSLLCRVRHDILCALSLEHVTETMRPLDVKPMAGVPSFIQGLAVVRGVPTAVVNAASLLTGEASAPTRFVTVRTGSRCIALAVDAVLGVIEISPDLVRTLPPLFQSAALDAVAATGASDAELVLILRSARLVPDDLWATIQTAATFA